MNIKGLRLTREFIRILNSQQKEIKSLKGCIDPFIDFRWKGFRKKKSCFLMHSMIVSKWGKALLSTYIIVSKIVDFRT